MSFVAAATTVGATVLGTGAAAGIGSTIVGGALIGAGVGGAYSALTGDGNVLDSMLTGAGIGGLAGGVGGAFFPGAAGYAAPTTAAVGTPAAGAYANPGISTSQQVANFANASSDPIGALAESGALSGGAGQTGITAANTGLTAKEMLGYGLGATTLMGLLGGKPDGVGAPSDKGMIRPFEYNTSRREPESGRPYYFQPIEYDQYGKTTAPIDTSERNYFAQSYTPLPTYKAAMGGQVPPNLNQMPAGGLAAIQGMRDGYGAPSTQYGNIPQFANGGQMPTNSMLEQMQQAKFERDMPDTMRDFTRAKRMGLLEGMMMGDDQARAMGQKPQGFMFAPQISQDGKSMQALASLNKDLTDDTEMKLMALGYKNPEKSGIANIGAGINKKLGKDSDISAYYEQSPDNQYKAYGAKYSKRFADGGMTDGHLGGYSDGGQLLKGPGDGVSDSIPASINDRQPARLADGEFVIPARIVSELGNGSTDAGAKRLYDMMDRIQSGRKKTVGKGKVAVDSKAKKHLPA